jgi:hypothetical protein
MGLINRASLPAEFLDLTSARLLKQPEPQYLYAQLWKMALAKSLSVPGQLGLAGRGIGSSGDGVDSAESHRLMFEDPVFGAAIANVAELGKPKVGHTVRLNRPYFANSAYAETDREIPSGSSISTTPLDLSSEQVTITLKRYGGPRGASEVQPYGLDRFDASVALHSLVDMVGEHMKRDFDKTIDTFMVNLLDLASTVVRPKGFSADADFTTQDAGPMDYEMLTRITQEMDEDGIPVFPNGRRVAVLTPRQIASLANDADWQRLSVFDKPANPLLSKMYFKSTETLDIFKSMTLDTDTNASSVTVHKGHAFGPGVIGSGVGDLPRVAFSTDDNYGETAKVVWLMYAGFKLLDNRFVVSVRTS